jgi:hypothetical protein
MQSNTFGLSTLAFAQHGRNKMAKLFETPPGRGGKIFEVTNLNENGPAVVYDFRPMDGVNPSMPIA